jgi:hypothetical protein
METAESLARWLKAERERLGWSTTQLADHARKLAHADGEMMTLTQQSMSGFENNKHPARKPAWFRYAEAAVKAAGGKADPGAAPPPSRLMLPVQLPSEPALTRMFAGHLIAIGKEQDIVDELAPLLARLLPGGLMQAQGLAPGQDEGEGIEPGALPRHLAKTDRARPPR